MLVATWLPFLLLLGYGVAVASTSLGASLLVWDDHPGQLYRVWHVVTYGWAPWRWDPGWWLGSPELQFYPPGFAYAGALVHRASLGALSVAASYTTLLWIAYLLPGLAAFALLRRACGDGWRALPGAFLALTLSAELTSGVEGGVHTGMVAARLAWALLPLLALSLTRSSSRAPALGASTIALLAAITLTHPAHVPGAVAIVLAFASPFAREGRRLAATLAGFALAAALTAFWAFPLVFRLGHSRALAWGHLDAVALTRPLMLTIVALALVALGDRRPAAAALARAPWIAVVIVLIDAMVAQPLGAAWLPAARIVDGAAMAFVVAAGLGAARVIDLVRDTRIPRGVAALAVVVALALLSLPGATLTLWPRAGDWPRAAPTMRALHVDELWEALRAAPPGRVIFTRSGLPLVAGEAWYRPHTHLTALTPLATGHAIVGGTFTHPSAVAAAVYRGKDERAPITRLAEQLDGHTLFGAPLASLDAGALEASADRLGASVLVALADDARALARVEDARLFTRRDVSSYVLYVRRTPAVVPERVADDTWRVRLHGQVGEWVPVRLAFYPLWTATVDGARVETRRGPLADLEVQLPRRDAVVELRYRAGLAERAGIAISAAAVVALALVGWRRRREKCPSGDDLSPGTPDIT